MRLQQPSGGCVSWHQVIIASTCALDTESGAFVAGIPESWESLLAEWLREPNNIVSVPDQTNPSTDILEAIHALDKRSGNDTTSNTTGHYDAIITTSGTLPHS